MKKYNEKIQYKSTVQKYNTKNTIQKYNTKYNTKIQYNNII